MNYRWSVLVDVATNALKASRRRFINATGIALLMALIVTGVALAANNGQLTGSGSISGEPVVGGTISFDINVVNDPPGVGVFYQDRLYNISGVVVLPPELTLNSCSISPTTVLQDTPSAGFTEIRFDNIKNLEVNERVDLSCTATLEPTVAIGDSFSIDYRWEAYTNPCESCPGEWRYFPGPTDGDFATISASAQAFDLEKTSNTTTGEAQVNGAGGYEPAPAPGQTAGPDWPYSYTLVLTNNPLHAVDDAKIFDIVPPGVAYLGNDTISCSLHGAPVTMTPTRTLSNGSIADTVNGSLVLEWDLDTVYASTTALMAGEVCTITYQTAIPYRERTFADGITIGGGPFSGPIVGSPDQNHQNNYYATGNYEDPINGPIPQIDGSTPGATPGDDAPVTVHSSYHSITKSSSTATVFQDTALTYTVRGFISEYYDFTASGATPYVITDRIPDGLDFCSRIAPADTDGYYDACPFTATSALFNGAPLDPVSVVVSGGDLLVTWHVTDPTAVQAGDTWTLTYQAIVRDFYTSGLPVSGLDARPNNVTASGTWNDLVSPPRTGTDSTNATTSIDVGSPEIDKAFWDSATSSWVQGPVTLEIGQAFKYQIKLSFQDDLDMRNVIVDDPLPMGQRYILNSADFSSSQGYADTTPPNTPQTAQGQYGGTTYQVEGAQNVGNFHIDFCPYNDTLSRVDGDSSDPFLTVLDSLGGRQRLEWFLCRIDNSDTGNQIIWQTEFQGVVVDDAQIYNECQVNNFAHLSGTNSFGTTYSLRDSLTAIYAVPNLVMRKVNTAPASVTSTSPFDYTLSVENDGGIGTVGNAYDWTIKDTIPAGLRVPATGGFCNSFSTTAPGDYTCVPDAGAQAGTGGFVTIIPVDALGDHDPARIIAPAAIYDFTFQAEMTSVSPGAATADEDLANTASVEYCTQAMPLDQDGDGDTDRRCTGYLDDTIPHSDEGGSATYTDFNNYVETDDVAPNGNETDNTDNSTIHIAALTTTKTHIAPVHVAPQVAGDFATIGEVYQVSLNVSLPARTILYGDPTAGYVELIDTINHEGAVFCDTASGITGCTDPVISQGGAVASPDTTGSPTAPNWWQMASGTPNPGSTVHFFLQDLDNGAGTSAYDFTVTFTMVVTGKNDAPADVFFLPANNDIVSNSFVLTYYNDKPTPEAFTTPAATDQINIDQPHISTDKEATSITRPGTGLLCNSAAACNGTQVQGNDIVGYTMIYTSDGESTAFDVSMVDQLTVYATYNSDMVCTSDTAIPVSGGVIATFPAPAPYSTELMIDTTPANNWDLPPGRHVTCTYTITVEPDVPAGTALGNFTDADWSTIDGIPVAPAPEERTFNDSDVNGDTVLNDDGTRDQDTENLQVTIPVAGKSRMAPGPTGPATQAPARIGDVIDYRITIPLPVGRTQDLVITDLPDAGLIYYEGGALTIRTNTLNPLTYAQTLTGTNDGIGAYSMAWTVWDPACTPVAGATHCILNDGTNNTVVTIDLQMIVADVPLNINGLVLDNTMQATFRDGLGTPRTITHGGPQDDEEVRITEPHISTTKTAAPTTGDAGDGIVYTVTMTNDGTATAYDLSFDENLDDQTDFNTGVPLSCTHSVSGSLANQLDIAPFDAAPDAVTTGMDVFRVAGSLDPNSNNWDLAPGQSITCTYTVTLLDTITPGYVASNLVDADWSSLDGTVFGGPTEPRERTYDDRDHNTSADSNGNGNPADDDDDAMGFPAHTATDDQATTTVTVPVPTAAKTRTSAATVQPGELVSYQIVVTLPEGTTSNLSITDTLPLPANAFRFESAAAPAAGWGGALPAFSAQPTIGDSGTLTWTFASPVTNPGDNNAVNNTITLSYTVRVYSNATAGANVNTAQASFTNPAGGTSQTNTSTATVTVVRPAITVSKTASAASADAGDTITYTVTVTNSGPAGTIAYDVLFDENLPDNTDFDTTFVLSCVRNPGAAAMNYEMDDLADGADTTPEAFSSGLDQFRIAGDLDENSNPWALASGESMVCQYRVVVLNTVIAGGTGANGIRNAVTGNFDSANNDQAGEQNFSASANTTVTVPAPTFTSKTRTNPVPGVDDVVQPGELASYRIVVTVPEGTTNGLQITDTLPTGFQFVSRDALTTGWGGALPAFSAEPAAGATGTLTWTFGAGVVNPGDNVANNTITLDYTVRVTAAATVTTTPLNNGNDAVNTGAASYVPAGGTTTSIGSGTARIDVLSPTIAVTKAVLVPSVLVADSGDTITYRVTITNTGPAGSVAYDVYLDENLSDFTDFDTSVALACTQAGSPVTYQMDDLGDGFDTVPDSFSTALDQFRIAGALDENGNPWVLNSGQSIVCTYQVRVLDTALAGGTGANAIQNTVAGHFDSADGDQPGEQNLTGTGTTTLTVPAASFTSKTRTAPVPSTDDTVQPGETVSYRIVLTVPEGTTNGIQITDTLPTGFQFVGTNSVVSGWGGALPGFSAQPAAGATGAITWTFGGAIVNPGDNVANNTVTLNYTVRVTTGAASNTVPLGNGNDTFNNAAATYIPPGGGATNIGTGSAAVDVVRPAIAVTKVRVPATASADAGDPIVYQVTITNNGPAGSIAYDVYFDENLSDNTDFDTSVDMDCTQAGVATSFEMDDLLAGGFDTIPDAFSSTLDQFRIAGSLDENSNPWVLNSGQSIVCIYQVVALDTVLAGGTGANGIRNTVIGNFDSVDGNQAGEQNFSATATRTLTIPAPTFTSKTRTNPVPGTDDIVQPGETVSYQITLTLPEGTNNSLQVTDVLPAGFQFVSTDSVVSGWGGAVPAFSAQPAPGATGTLTWTFGGAVVNPGDNVANNTLVINYTGRVTNAATSNATPLNNGDDSVNTGAASYIPPGGVRTTIGTGTARVDVVRPTLTVTKTVSPASPNLVDAGDVLTYTVTMSNTGPAGTVLHDLYFDENLDDMTDYVIPSTLSCVLNPGATPLTSQLDLSPFDGTPDSAISTMDQFRIAGALAENSNPWALASGQSIACSYQVVANQDVPATDSIDNAVAGHADSFDGDSASEENYSGNASTTLRTPDATITKDNDTSAASYHADDTYAPGELVPYSLTVRAPEGAILNLVVCDNLPAQLGYDSTSSIGNSDGFVYTLSTHYSILTAGFPVACPAGTDVAYVFSSPLVLNNVANANNNTAIGDFKTITIHYLARLLNTATNGQTLTNTATLAYTRGDTGATRSGTDTETINTEVVTQNTDKAITRIRRGVTDLCTIAPACDSIQVIGGDVLTYNLSVTNTHATATAYDVTMSDNLSASLSYNGDLSCARTPGGPIATTPPAAGSDPVLINAAAIGTVNLLPGEVLTCTYTASVDAGVAAAAPLTNVVTGTVTTATGTPPQDTNINDTGTDTATSAAIDLQLTKTINTPTAYVGNTVVFTLTLNNLGPGPATGVTVQDVMPTGFTFVSANPAPAYNSGTGIWTVGGLAAGASTQLEITATVAATGPYTNYTQVSHADQPDVDSTPGDASTTQDDDDVVTLDVLPTLDVVKTANPTTLPEAGGPVTFTVQVTNTSPEPETLTTLSDNIYGNLNGQGTCAVPQTIAAGATYTCAFTQTIPSTPGVTHTDIVTATVTDGQGNSASDNDDATVAVVDVLPSLVVQKTASATTINEPGGNITFTIQVTNTSIEDDVLTILDDDVFGDLNGMGTCATGGTIAAGATYTCSFTQSITGPGGTVHHDTVTGTITDDEGNDATDDDDATVTILEVLEVTKTANPTTVPEPGAAVTFTVAVQNTSPAPVTLTTLTDDVFGNLNGMGTCATGGTIAAGATYSCTFTQTISGNAGFVHTDTVTAEVTDGGGQAATDDDDATVTVTDVLPTISVSKTPVPGSLNEPGGNVTFTVVVNNTSPESLTLTALTDSVYGSLNGQGSCAVPQTIAVGGNYTCAFTQNVTGDAGDTHTDTVTATGNDDENNTATNQGTANVPILDVLPSLTIAKTANPTTLSEPGGNVTFTVQVDNTSVETVTLTTLNDNVFGNLDGQGTCDVPQTIAVGGSYTCSFTQAVNGNAGFVHTDTVTGTITDNDGNSASSNDDASVTIVDVLPTLNVLKTANPVSMPEPGGNVTFTVQVDNTSVEQVTLTTLTDDVYGNLDGQGTCDVPQTIAVGGSYTCTFTQSITGNAGDVHTDTVTGTVRDDENNSASADDDATVTIGDFTLLTIDVVKTANPTSVSEPGDDVTFTVDVTNTSPEELTLTSLDDDIYGDLDGQGTCSVPQTIAVGDTYSCTFTQTINGNAGDVHTDVVTGNAEDDEGNPAEDDDDAVVTVTDVMPALTVTKTANPTVLNEPGGSVTFTVDVRNDSVEQITLTTLSDNVYGNLDGQGTCDVPQTIAVGATYSCSFIQTVNGNAGDVHTDTVTATGHDDENNDATDTDDATVDIQDVPPTITVSKTPSVGSVPEPGATVTFTVVVTNTSTAESLTLTTLNDSIFGNLDGQGTCDVPQTIAVGAAYTCTFDGMVTGNAGDTHTNTITATATDDDGNSDGENDDADVDITDVLPTIIVTKTAGVAYVNEPGGNVTFTVDVQNASVEQVTLNTLTDDMFGNLDGQGTCDVPQTIAAGATYSCSFTSNVTGPVGSIHTNTVTASADDDDGNTASDDDDADVLIADVIDVSKSPSPSSLPEPSGNVTYTVVVTNLTAAPITLDTLDDDIFGDLDGQGTCTLPQTIAAAANYTCDFTQTITGNAGDTHTNIVTASATDDNGDSASDDDDADVTFTDALPTIAVTKTANPISLFEPGGNVTFTVDVQNTSAETVTLMTLTDDVFGNLSGVGTCATGGTIAAGATYTCSFTQALTGNAGDTHIDTVTATADDDEGNTASDDDDASVTFNATADLELTKTVSDATPDMGTTVTFTLTLVNNGPSTATNVEVTDLLPAGYTYSTDNPSQGSYNDTTGLWTVGTLTNGQTVTLTIDAVVGPVGPYDNYTEITGTDQHDSDSTPDNGSTGEDDDDTVPVTPIAGCVSGTLYMDDNRNGSQDGGEGILPGVTLRLFDGGGALIATVVSDTNGQYTFPSIPTGTYTVEIDQATLPAGTPIFITPGNPTQTVVVSVGGICALGDYGLLITDPVITKTGSPTTARRGDLVTFTIQVTNTSSTTAMNNVIINDPLNGFFDYQTSSTSQGTSSYDALTHIVRFDLGTLAPSATVTMTVEVRVSNSAPRPASIPNQATVSYDNGTNMTSPVVTVQVPSPSTGGGGGGGGGGSSSSPTATPTPAPTATPGGPSVLPNTGYGDDGGASGTSTGQGLGLALAIAAAMAAAGLIVVLLGRSAASLKTQVGVLTGLAVAIGAVAVLIGLATPGETPSPEAAAQKPTTAAQHDTVADAPTSVPVEPTKAPAKTEETTPEAMEPLQLATRLLIPSIDVDATIATAPLLGETWDMSALRQEVGYLAGTAYPGAQGNAVLAGHVMLKGGINGPFVRLHDLSPGDLIVTEGDTSAFVYRVVWIKEVDEDAIDVISPTDTPMLTVITCTQWSVDLHAYTKRLIVRAELIEEHDTGG